MNQPENAMDIFRLLDQSNCRECGKKTCLAFAGAVYTGQKKLSECPKLDTLTIAQLSKESKESTPIEGDGERALKDLLDQVVQMDFEGRARQIGAEFDGTRLSTSILGKRMSIDANGRLLSDIHINPWVVVPFLYYILHGRGLQASGHWISFRELKGGQQRYPLFQKRCETAIRRLADRHAGLFEDIVHLFNGRQVEKQFEADISVLLHPLPRVPVMLCYWRPEDGMDSSVNVFFDDTADKNLDIETAFTLGVGLAQMFEKLSLRHGLGGGIQSDSLETPRY